MSSGTKRQWLLPAFIVLCVLFLFFAASRFSLPSKARAQLKAGEQNGILVIPIQIGRESSALAMVDTVGQTLWVYELSIKAPPHSRLKLLAARSWRYDKMLQQYNTAEPTPEQVRILLQNLGKKKGAGLDYLQIIEPNSGN